MEITVVIPMFNNENSIQNAMDSVKNQTRLDYIKEIIVVDDGSTDNSYEVVVNYANRNKNLPINIIKKENGGASSARNAGMKVATKKFIALLDADDEWLENKIELQMNILKSNPEIDFLGGNYNGKELRILFKKIDKLYKASVKDLCLKFFPVTPSAIFKRSIIEKIGYFDEKQKFAEDGNYFLRICTHFNYYHLPTDLVHVGSGKPEFGHSGLSANLKGMYEGNIKNIKELKDFSIISSFFYIFLRIFYWFKYIRRIIITHLNKKKV